MPESSITFVKVSRAVTVSVVAASVVVAVLFSGCTAQKIKKDSAIVAQSHLELGVAYLDQGRMDLSMMHLEMALAVEPSGAEIHYALALLHLKRGEEQQSEQHFLRSMRERKSYSEAQNGYGVLLCRQGRVEEAAIYFQLAVSNPGYITPEIASENERVCGEEKT